MAGDFAFLLPTHFLGDLGKIIGIKLDWSTLEYFLEYTVSMYIVLCLAKMSEILSRGLGSTVCY